MKKNNLNLTNKEKEDLLKTFKEKIIKHKKVLRENWRKFLDKPINNNKKSIEQFGSAIPNSGDVITSPLGTQYRIIAEIYRGASSIAFRCVDVTTAKEVCLKCNILEGREESITEEISISERLSSISDNYVQFIESFDFNRHKFMVCELLEKDLYNFGVRYPNRARYFTMKNLQSIAKQVLESLAILDDHDLVHCDLKPENILFKSAVQCTVKVIDFGNSVASAELKEDEPIQTKPYRAPEVILCEGPLNSKIDIWSLGCILFELLTDQILFDRTTTAKMLADIIVCCGEIPDTMMTLKRTGGMSLTPFPEYDEQFRVVGLAATDGRRVLDGTLKPYRPNRFRLVDELHSVGCHDAEFISFMESLLTVDMARRPRARQALQHAFLTKAYADTVKSYHLRPTGSQTTTGPFSLREMEARLMIGTTNPITAIEILRDDLPEWLPCVKFPELATYYVSIEGVQHGPLKLRDCKSLLQFGSKPVSLIWKTDTVAWVQLPAGIVEFPELREAYESRAIVARPALAVSVPTSPRLGSPLASAAAVGSVAAPAPAPAPVYFIEGEPKFSHTFDEIIGLYRQRIINRDTVIRTSDGISRPLHQIRLFADALASELAAELQAKKKYLKYKQKYFQLKNLM